MDVRPEKLDAALHILARWTQDNGLKPVQTEYLAGTRDRRPLCFSLGGDADREHRYRTHGLSPSLPEAKQQKLAERQAKAPDLVVISALKDWTCRECSGTGDFLFMEGPGPLCLACADLDAQVFLPSGDTALTRRARKASTLCAVVVRFSRSRGRYERQGLLVEEQALAQAEQQCLDDEDVRRRRRVREEIRRADQAVTFQAEFAEEIRRQFPGCPPERAQAIAEHAGARGSGRVGRSAAGRALDAEAVTLAVVASVRHGDTNYDELLMSGIPRTAGPGAGPGRRAGSRGLAIRPGLRAWMFDIEVRDERSAAP